MTTITITLSENHSQMHIQTDRPSREANAELNRAIDVLKMEIEEMPASHFGQCKLCGFSNPYHSPSCADNPRYTI